LIELLGWLSARLSFYLFIIAFNILFDSLFSDIRSFSSVWDFPSFSSFGSHLDYYPFWLSLFGTQSFLLFPFYTVLEEAWLIGKGEV